MSKIDRIRLFIGDLCFSFLFNIVYLALIVSFGDSGKPFDKYTRCFHHWVTWKMLLLLTPLTYTMFATCFKAHRGQSNPKTKEE